MATRMTTPLYGDTPGIDVEPGNRVDSATSGVVRKVAPVRPPYPTPTPWLRRQPLALRGLLAGIIAAAVVFAGLALFGVAVMWSSGMTALAQGILMMVGAVLTASGVAYVASARPELA